MATYIKQDDKCNYFLIVGYLRNNVIVFLKLFFGKI